MLVYAPGRTYAGVDCRAVLREGTGAAGVCRVRGLQLLMNRGTFAQVGGRWVGDFIHSCPMFESSQDMSDRAHRAPCK